VRTDAALLLRFADVAVELGFQSRKPQNRDDGGGHVIPLGECGSTYLVYK